MQENCHGVLPQSAAKQQGERNPGSKLAVGIKNLSEYSDGLKEREKENRPPNEAKLRGLGT